MVFFITTLAAVLVGFSLSLTILANIYLKRHVQQRLESIINTLAAATDVGPEGVEWEPRERLMTIPSEAMGSESTWAIIDEHGLVIDKSHNLIHATDVATLVDAVGGAVHSKNHSINRISLQDQPWQMLGKLIVAPVGENGIDEDERLHTRLSIAAAVQLEPLYAAERKLAAVLALLSAAIWIAAFFAGKRICRTALQPVTRMASFAAGMGAEDLSERLPVPTASDELKDLAQSFNKLLDRVEELFIKQQRFTGDTSHQLRTPLTVILGQIEVALRRDRTELEYRQTLLTVQRRAMHLKQMVDALLFLARADADAVFPDGETINFSQWLPDHLATWSEHDRFVDLQWELKGEGLATTVPPTLFAELLDILIHNACKYSHSGTPIVIQVERLDGELCISVADQGMGVDDSEKDQLFDPFFRSPRSRERGVEGTGLGLSVAR